MNFLHIDYTWKEWHVIDLSKFAMWSCLISTLPLSNNFNLTGGPIMDKWVG